MSEVDHLAELNRRNAYVRDRVRGVVLRTQPGFYLFGRPGTAKTYTVRKTLDELGIKYGYHVGHLTPIGLFELLEGRQDGITVLDDVGTLFTQPTAIQLLLAALGHQPNGPRLIKYKRQGHDVTIRFTGGIIAVSNLELHQGPTLDALKSRVHVCRYNPSDDEVAAIMRDLTEKGWHRTSIVLKPEECCEVREYLIAEATRLGVRLDLRMLLDKALPDYAQWVEKKAETHWRDLVTIGLTERVDELIHTPVQPRKQQKQAEHDIILRIQQDHAKRSDQLRQWTRETGKSERAYWRRLREIEGNGSTDSN